MSDLARVSGKTFQTIELDGKTYTLRPDTVGIWAEMSALVRATKGDPIAEVCRRLGEIPPEQHAAWMKAAVEAAARQSPSDKDLVEFEQSLLGKAFGLWAALKADHLADFPTPHAVLDELVALNQREGEAKLKEIMLKLELASGKHDLKNCDGRRGTLRVTPA
jgi:hypothetical protein